MVLTVLWCYVMVLAQIIVLTRVMGLARVIVLAHVMVLAYVLVIIQKYKLRHNMGVTITMFNNMI